MRAEIIIGYSCCPLTREAFEAHGHTVWTCDKLPARGSQERHLQADIRDVLAERHFDFGIFHPMCTYLTLSAAWAYADPDFVKYPGVGYHQRVKPETLTGAARRAARAAEVENFEWLQSLPFDAVNENPGGSFLSTMYRPACQIIHPHQFGDDASKATGLWRNNPRIPLLQPTGHVEPRWVTGPAGKLLPRWANQTDSGQNKLGPSDPDRWLRRSDTYPGIAAAMGDQYGRWLAERAR